MDALASKLLCHPWLDELINVLKPFLKITWNRPLIISLQAQLDKQCQYLRNIGANGVFKTLMDTFILKYMLNLPFCPYDLRAVIY